MKKGLVFTAFLLVMLSSVSAAVSHSSLDSVGNDEFVEVVVELNENDAYSLFSSSSEDVQDRFLSDLALENYNVTYVSHTTDAVSLIVSKEELDELEKREDIAGIRREFQFNLQLQDSISIVNSSLATNLQINGTNITGAGQTVCIIDSGIDYTHPAFGGCTTEQFLSGNCSKVIGGYAFYNPVNASNNNTVMGDSDHGTHVAGIIAGVAPDAKIVAIKACGPGSGCGTLAVLDGINWCVSNSTIYNISVISMSLGTGAPDLFDSFCDDDSPEFSEAINAATAKNISVIVAAGNDGNNTHISLPACIRNATAVGATNKDDSIASYSNRNRLVRLFAPGSEINSSILSGGYAFIGGTSMATPHVAAAFAMVKQLLGVINEDRSIEETVSILNSTGRNLDDTTGIDYSRINIYDALTYIGNNVTLLSPNDSYAPTGSSVSVEFNFSMHTQMNATFSYCTLNSNSVDVASVNITNSTAIQNISHTFTPGTYTWLVGCASSLSNVIYSETKTLTVNAPEQEQQTSSRSGGGGGGGGSKTYSAMSSELEEGYGQPLRKGEKIQFTIASSKHTLTVDSVSKTSANLTVRSTPINLQLDVGESARLNLTSGTTYDLLVSLESISSGRAAVTIKSINESIIEKPMNRTRTEWNISLLEEELSAETMGESNAESERELPYAGILVITLVIILGVIYFKMRLSGERRKKSLKRLLGKSR